MDIAVLAHGGEVFLLQNTTRSDNNWLGLRLRQSGGNPFAVGAMVTVESTSMTQTAQVGGGGSYLSQHSTDLNFGLGPTDRIVKVTIKWPDGMVDSYQDFSLNMVNQIQHVVNYNGIKK